MIFQYPPSPSDTVSNTSPLQTQNLMWIWPKIQFFVCSKLKFWKIFACGGPPTGSRLKRRAASGGPLRGGLNGQNFGQIFKNHSQFSKNEIPDPPFPNFCNTSPLPLQYRFQYSPPPPSIPVPTTGWQVCHHVMSSCYVPLRYSVSFCLVPVDDKWHSIISL